MTNRRTELAAALRQWRDRARPGDLGLPVRSARRVPGIRREELATLANLSVDYVVRLEQGRAERPSAQVVSALGRALRLSHDELEHLYLLAGLLPPGRLTVSRHIPPGVQRMITQLVGTPVAVFDATWTLLACNELWSALLGDDASRIGQSLVRDTFTADSRQTLVEDDQLDRFRRALVSDVRAACGRYPQDRALQGLVAEMLSDSEPFARYWAEGVVQPFEMERKRVHSPVIGSITLDCDVLTTTHDDLRVVLYTTDPSSDEAARLGDLARFAAR